MTRRLIVSEQSFVLAALAAGLAVRLVAMLVLGDRSIPYEWGVIVSNVVHGHGFSYYTIDPSTGSPVAQLLPGAVTFLPSAYMPPLYAALLAGLWLATGSEAGAVWAVLLLQCFMGAATSWLLYGTCKQILKNRTAAALALVGTLAYPALVYAPSQVSSFVLYVFLSQLVLYFLSLGFDLFAKPHRFMLIAAGGASMGLLILSRAEAVLFALAIVGAMPFVWQGRRREPVTAIEKQKAGSSSLALPMICFLLPAVLVISPWVVRNYVVFGGPSPLTLSGGHNLWQGQNAQATGVHGASVEPPVEPTGDLKLALARLQPTDRYEIEVDNLFLTEAQRAMVDDPIRVATLGLKKLFMYWSGLYTDISLNYSGAMSPFVVLPWLVLIGLAIPGAVASAGKWRELLNIYGLVIASTSTVFVFFVMPRYNLLLTYSLAVFASAAIAPATRRLLFRLSILKDTRASDSSGLV